MKGSNSAKNASPNFSMGSSEFSEAGHRLVDRIAAFLRQLPELPVTKSESPSQIRAILGQKKLPVDGTSEDILLQEAADLLFNHSLFNGHPAFWGYITSSASPFGALGDLLASVVNPNVSAYTLSPMATEIERQTIQWICEFIGYSAGSSGLFVSGGNMANISGFVAARRAKSDWDIRKEGLKGGKHLLLYCSKGTHTWVQKAADISGVGTNSIRWIEMNEALQMDVQKLEEQITVDITNGYKPFMVIGTAGSVSTGAIDPLAEIATICRKYNLWFHVDGAYGAPAASLPEHAEAFNGLREADSIAIDPHKWLYSPLEAGCLLVRDKKFLADAFSFDPEYFNFKEIEGSTAVNFLEYGLQNSRGFRALKVWLGLRQAGLRGYQYMIRSNIELAETLFEMVEAQEEMEAVTQNLSITTFRYVPRTSQEMDTEYLNKLNEALLNSLQKSGKVYLSNAVIDGKYCLRVCVVNFRSTYEHLKMLVELVLREGRRIEREMRG